MPLPSPDRSTIRLLLLVLATAGTFASGCAAPKRAADGQLQGIETATYPKQAVPPEGLAIGVAMPKPHSLRADFLVPVPPVGQQNQLVSIPVQLPGKPEVMMPVADVNMNVYPAQAQTLATTGSEALQSPSGLVALGDVAYVVAGTSLAKIDLGSGAIDVLAALPATPECAGASADVVSDGRDLFVGGPCEISKISLTGTVSSLEPWSGPLAFGPDGYLYAGASDHGVPAIERIDPATGAVQRYVAFPSGSWVVSLAADSAYLWAAVDEGPSDPTVIDRIGFGDGAITRYARPGVDIVGEGQMVSAGLYLYAPSVGNLGLIEFGKPLGRWGLAVGGTAGDRDGEWSMASFGMLWGIASDGRQLWVTDRDNSNVRRVDYSAHAGLGLGA